MKFRTLIPALGLGTLCTAQAPSDSLFNTEQVVSVHLTFPQDEFWDLLTTYYENDLGETLTGSVTITDATGTCTRDSVAVDLKGNSSYSHPGNKKSFKIDFNDHMPGQKFHGVTKLHFNNCWSDPTFMREKIFFDYCREMGVLAPRVQYADVYINDTFWGFYDMVEAVDKNFLDRWVDDNDGNLFKAGDNFGMGGGGGGNSLEADLKYYGANASDYAGRYELKTNEDVNIWTDLIELLDVLNNGTDEQVQNQLPSYFVWEPLLRSLALDDLFGNLDAYIQSARNYYLYHDSTTLQWNWVHWDANMAFGSYPAQGQNALTLSPTYVAQNRPLMARIIAIPALRLDYLNAFCAVHDQFTHDHLDARMEAIKEVIQTHVDADVNKQYTYGQFLTNIESDVTVQGGGGGGGGGGMQTIRGLRSFITARNNSLNTTLNCSTVGVEEMIGTDRSETYPNPTSGSVRIGLPAGVAMNELVLTDLAGRRVQPEVLANGLDLSGLPAGTYLLTRSGGATFPPVRLVKQ